MKPRKQSRIIGLRPEPSLRSTLKGIRQRFQLEPADSSTAAVQVTPEPERDLPALPYDIILAIFMLLDPLDMYHLSKSSRSFYEVSQDGSIWRCRADDLMRRPRLLVFDEISNSKLLSTKELRMSIIRSYLLSHVWGKDIIQRPPVHRSSCHNLPHPVDSGPYFPMDQFMVMPPGFDSVVGLRLIQGRHESRGTQYLPFGEITFHPQYQSGTHFMALNRCRQTIVGETIFLAIFLSPISPLDWFGRSASFMINPHKLPRGGQLIEQIVDIANKRLYALYAQSPGARLEVYVIFDWGSGQCAAFKTGLRSGVAASLRIVPNGQEFDICTEETHIWRSETYALSQLTDKTAPFENIIRADREYLSPMRNITYSFDPWSDPIMRSLHRLILYKYWTIPQPVQYSGSTPTIFSHIRLYRSAVSLETRKVWRVEQYYSDTDGPYCTAQSFFSIKNLALQDNSLAEHSPPLLCVAFTHMAWVELVRAPALMGVSRSSKRVLKLASFRGSGAGIGGCEEEKEPQVPVTMDIPVQALESACGIYFEPAPARIYILTTGNTLYTFQYA